MGRCRLIFGNWTVAGLTVGMTATGDFDGRGGMLGVAIDFDLKDLLHKEGEGTCGWSFPICSLRSPVSWVSSRRGNIAVAPFRFLKLGDLVTRRARAVL